MSEAQHDAGRRGARWTDAVTALVLCIATGGALSAAAPALLRTAGLDVGAPSLASTGHPIPQHPPVDVRDRGFVFAPEDEDEPRLTELERLYPDAPWPGQRSASDRPRRHGAQDPFEVTTLVRVRRPLTIRMQPGPDGAVLAQVQAGELVTILDELGDWVLVTHKRSGSVIKGFVKKSEIAVR